MGTKIVNCSVCGKELFIMPYNYKMACKVTCMGCSTKKKSKLPVKVKRTAVCNFARAKKGVRKDVHPTYSFRSATEANFARILNYHNIEWKYEERAFTFDGYKTKPHVYVMDFEILTAAKKHKQEAPEDLVIGFYEIKGYMTPNSRNKLRRLKKQYPEEFKNTCVVLYHSSKKKDIEFCEKNEYKYMFYNELEKKYKSLIPEWE